MLILVSILLGYLWILSVSFFFDPKVRGFSKYAWARSIYHLIGLSAVKMCVAVGLTIIGALLSKCTLIPVLGLAGFRFDWTSTWKGLIAALGFWTLHTICAVILRGFGSRSLEQKSVGRPEETVVSMLPGRWLPLLGTFALISLEAGMLEEFFFRGIMQSNFYDTVSPVLAAVLVALLFGIAHFYQRMRGMVETFILGLWLGFAFVAAENLFVPVFGHVMGNFLCMVVGAREMVARRKTLRVSSE